MTNRSGGWSGRGWLLLASLGLCAAGCGSRSEAPAKAPEELPAGEALTVPVPPAETPPEGVSSVKDPQREPAPGPVGQPRLVLNINQTLQPFGSHPDRFVKLGDTLLFTASTPNEGRKLWRWEARGGASRVDLRPSPESFPTGFPELVRLGRFVYFSALTDSRDPALTLWRSDGTREGTEPVTGLVPPGAVSLNHLGDVPGRLLLTRTVGETLELWSSDGTPQGSRLLWTSPGPRVLRERIVEAHGALFFTTNASCSFGWESPRECPFASELWRVDATGARLLWRAEPGGAISQLTAWNDSLVLSVADGEGRVALWKTDANAEERVRLVELEPRSEFHRLLPTPGRLFFLASRTWESGFGVWASDGTAEGTVRLHDIHTERPSRHDVYVSETAVVGTTLHFVAPGVFPGPYELWSSDGTLEGTRQVHSAPSEPLHLLAYERRLYFTQTDRLGNHDWMRTALDAPGAERVKTFILWPKSRALTPPRDFTVQGGEIFFAADDERGLEPWTSRGTDASTRLLQDIVPSEGASDPKRLTVVGDTLFFTADDGVRGQELWSTRGSAADTRLVHEFTPGPQPTYFDSMVPWNAQLAIASPNALWLVDGSARAPRLVREHRPGRGACEYFTVYAECARSVVAAGETLYVVDSVIDTSSWTLRHDLFSLRGEESIQRRYSWTTAPPRQPSARGTSLVFTVASALPDGTRQHALWTSEGASGDTHLLQSLPVRAEGLVWLGSTPFFTSLAEDFTGMKLWTLDGVTGEARMVPTGDPHLNVHEQLVPVAGRRVFFFSRSVADPLPDNHVLWVSDGTSAGTRPLKKIPGRTVQRLYAVGEQVFFWCHEPGEGWGLWRSDGSERGTVRVKALTPLLGEPLLALPEGRGLVFAASDGVSGTEVWWSDGTEQGTVLFTDIAPGPTSSNPGAFAVMGDTLYFAADDQRVGRELWAAPLPPAPQSR